MSKVGAADPAAVLQSFSSHLIAQLESRPVKDDAARAAVLAHADGDGAGERRRGGALEHRRMQRDQERGQLHRGNASRHRR